MIGLEWAGSAGSSRAEARAGGCRTDLGAAGEAYQGPELMEPLLQRSNLMTDLPSPDAPPLLAYKNPGFLDSDDGRPLRILAEYLEPLHRMKREQIHDTVVFFGSARLKEDGPLGRYYSEARELARTLTQWSLTLPGCCRFTVCSGGGGGIMEAANRGAAEAGGRTIGLNIGLPREQRPNQYLSQGLSFEFHYFFMRKLWFAHLARALVVFPGGFGTLDELMEVLTLSQTHKLDQRITVVLYGTSYWREVVSFDALVRHGMIDAEDLQLFHMADDPATAFAILQRMLPKEQPAATPAFAKSCTSDAIASEADAAGCHGQPACHHRLPAGAEANSRMG